MCEEDPTKPEGYRCSCQECSSVFDSVKVCGSDRNIYQNECELKYESCRTKTLITIIDKGQCGEYLALFSFLKVMFCLILFFFVLVYSVLFTLLQITSLYFMFLSF